MLAVKSSGKNLSDTGSTLRLLDSATVVAGGATGPCSVSSPDLHTRSAPPIEAVNDDNCVHTHIVRLPSANALVAFGNITDYATNYAFVERVLAMDTTNFGLGQDVNLDSDIMWRAIDSPVAANVGYIGLIIVEALAGIVLLIAVIAWIRYLRGTVTLAAARALATLGLVLVLLVFFTAFITVGGEWFSMWRSTD